MRGVFKITYSIVVLEKAQLCFRRQTVHFVGGTLRYVHTHACVHAHPYTSVLQKIKLAS